MTEMLHDLLSEPSIGVGYSGGREAQLTLPQVLSGMANDDVQSFTSLQVHQTHAWHAFLCQLAAIVLHQSGTGKPPLDTDWWTEQLIAAANGERSAWCLVVKDLSKPAFLQPPVPEDTLDRFNQVGRFPDLLDVLITTKNHDVKARRIRNARPEHWLYALVSLQTMQGVLGRNNYGIARMNQGFGSRPCVSFAASLSRSHRFLRDVAVLLEIREQLVREHGYKVSGGLALVWLHEWDGLDSLDIGRLDPFFIEVCRRIRLTNERRFTAFKAPSKVPRIAAKELKGDTGDPWTPISKDKGAALTVSGTGFSYKLTHQLIVGSDYRMGPTADLRPEDGNAPIFLACTLVRGRGETDGWHERIIPIPPKVRPLLGVGSEPRNRLADLARWRVEQTAAAERYVLKPALCVLLQGGPDSIDFRDERPRAWLDGFDRAVDERFFDCLWEDADLDTQEAHRRWERVILDLAERQLKGAMQSVPLPSVRRYRALSAAERMFRGARSKRFPEWRPYQLEDRRSEHD